MGTILDERGLEIKEKLQKFDYFLSINEKSKGTRISYLNSIKVFFNEYESITKENMIAFKENQIAEHSPNTARLRVVALNKYCDFIGATDCKVSSVKIHNPNSIENVPTLREYNHLLKCLANDGKWKLYWMLRFIAATGVRASELVSLEQSCLSSGTFTMLTKGKIRRIIIPKKLIKESKEYFETVDSKYLFPNRYGEKMKASSVSKMLKQVGSSYNIRPEILHAHSFRHLFAVQFLEKNKDISLLANLLGHENIRTTAIYTQLSLNKQKEALDKIVDW